MDGRLDQVNLPNPLAPKITVREIEQPEPLIPPEPPYVTGGPAFPAHPSDANADEAGQGGYGVSILDYFAAHAIQGLCARADLTVDDLKAGGAQDAYWIAATMVDVRKNLPIEVTPVPVTPSEETGPGHAPG